jgi:hypothetical protein
LISHPEDRKYSESVLEQGVEEKMSTEGHSWGRGRGRLQRTPRATEFKESKNEYFKEKCDFLRSKILNY